MTTRIVPSRPWRLPSRIRKHTGPENQPIRTFQPRFPSHNDESWPATYLDVKALATIRCFLTGVRLLSVSRKQVSLTAAIRTRLEAQHMAKGRRGGPSRLDKRRENEAYEKQQEEEREETETEEEEEEEEEAEGEGEGEGDAEADLDADLDLELDAESEPDAELDEGDEDGKPRRKKAKKVVKKAAPKKTTTKRSRAAKEVRTRAVWVVYDNSSKIVEKFPYNQKADAEALLAKKLEEKKTFYINLVKEEIKD